MSPIERRENRFCLLGSAVYCDRIKFPVANWELAVLGSHPESVEHIEWDGRVQKLSITYHWVLMLLTVATPRFCRTGKWTYAKIDGG